MPRDEPDVAHPGLALRPNLNQHPRAMKPTDTAKGHEEALSPPAPKKLRFTATASPSEGLERSIWTDKLRAGTRCRKCGQVEDDHRYPEGQRLWQTTTFPAARTYDALLESSPSRGANSSRNPPTSLHPHGTPPHRRSSTSSRSLD